MRAKLSIISLVILGALTGLCFYLVRSNVESKVERAAKERLNGLFAATWELIEADAHEAVRMATEITEKYRNEFITFKKDQEALESFLKLKINSMEEGKRPDIAVIMVKGRVLASHVPNELLPKSTMEKLKSGLTNKSVDFDLASKVFAHKLQKKDGEPASALVPAGWAKPKIYVDEIKKSKHISKSLPSAAAAPIVLFFDSGGQLSTGGTPRRLGALVLGWKEAVEPRESREIVQTLAADSDLRNKHFWAAYKSDRGRLSTVLANAEKELSAEGRGPAFMALVDEKGVVLHRDKGTKYFVGESLGERYLSLNTVLSTGLAESDIWSSRELASIAESKKEGGGKDTESSMRSNLLRMGMAPFRGDDGRIVGGICVGWSLSDRKATQIGNYLGVGVVFLEGDSYAASTKGLGVVSKQTIEKLTANRVEKKKYSKADGSVEFEGLKAVPVTVGGKEFLGASGVMTGSRKVGAHTFLTLLSVEDAKEPLEAVSWVIILLGGFAIVMVLLMIFLMSRHFLKPLDELYSGVNEMLSGDLEYTFGVASSETEGLSYALNALLAKLLGRPEPEDEEDEVEGDSTVEATLELGPMPDAAVAPTDEAVVSIAAESDDDHYKRIFSEYVDALDQYGEDVSAFTYDVFRQRLDVNVRVIKDRYEVGKVRFKIVSGSEGKPLLDSYPIKE